MNKLREAEILLSQGATIAVISKKIGISNHTYYRWCKEYGGMRLDQARHLEVANASLTIIQLVDGKFRLRLLNDTGHLERNLQL